MKVAAYMYIGGLNNDSVRADLMTNWQTRKYATLMEWQTRAAKNSLWRSSTVITPRSGSSNSHHYKGKAPILQSTSMRHHPNVFKHKTSGSHGSFGASGSKDTSNTLRVWGQPKDTKADFKGSSKYITFGKRLKRESSNSRNYDSWNNAKKTIGG